MHKKGSPEKDIPISWVSRCMTEKRQRSLALTWEQHRFLANVKLVERKGVGGLSGHYDDSFDGIMPMASVRLGILHKNNA